MPQDTGFSSLFLKVLMQILQWLDSPAVEAGPLQAQLKLFAAQYSARRRISDGEAGEAAAAARGPRLSAFVSGAHGHIQRGVWGGVTGVGPAIWGSGLWGWRLLGGRE